MKTKKIFLVLIVLAVLLIPMNVFAYSPVFWGWSSDTAYSNSNYLHETTLLGGLDNRYSSIPGPYSFSQTVSRSWGKSGSLASSISGTTSGLGAEISATLSWNFTESYSQEQSYGPVTVPPYERLRLYGKIYGGKSFGIAAHYVFWIPDDVGNWEVKSYTACVLNPIWD